MSVLTVNNLRKTFGNNEVLKGINFKVEEGEVVSVIGSSGSGKTTLLRCITGLEHPDSGLISVEDEVFFDGSNAKISSAEKRRRQRLVGLVFQNFNLFPQYTALQNVTLACELIAKERPDYKQNKSAIIEEIRENAKDLLCRVGLSDRMDMYPCQLSGGQQQRVSIARALALNPKILFFDEPTSALDPELTGEILKVIQSLAAEHTTMVIVTHEMAFARDVSDKIIFMNEGIILEEGSPDDVFLNPKHERTRAFLSKFTNG